MAKPQRALTHDAASPEALRLALATAIRARDKARAVDREQHAAEARARRLLANAEARHAAATEALQIAKTKAAVRLAVAAKAGQAAPPSQDLSLARAELVASEDDVAAAVDALAQCAPSPEDAAAQQAVEHAADAVLGAAAPALLAETERLQATVLRNRLVLHYLLLRLDAASDARGVIGTEGAAIRAFLASPWLLRERSETWLDDPALAPWHAARVALLDSADVALPAP
jgi:hypothetical protein